MYTIDQLSPPQRLPLGIPIKIAIIEKIESGQGTMGRGKRREPLPYNVFKMTPNFRGSLSSLFPFPMVPRALSLSSLAMIRHKL